MVTDGKCTQPSRFTGHSGNVALFIPRSMRGCYRRRRRRHYPSKRAKERREGSGRKRSRGGRGTRWRTKKGWWMGWTCTILHSIPRHFCVAAFAPVLLDAFSFLALTLFAYFLFPRTRSPLFRHLPRSRAHSTALEDESRSTGRSRTRNVATASLHASPVMGRETRFTSSFVKRVVLTAVSRNSDVSSRLFRDAAPSRAILTRYDCFSRSL